MSRDSLDGVMEVVTWEFLTKVISTRPNLVDTVQYICVGRYKRTNSCFGQLIINQCRILQKRKWCMPKGPVYGIKNGKLCKFRPSFAHLRARKLSASGLRLSPGLCLWTPEPLIRISGSACGPRRGKARDPHTDSLFALRMCCPKLNGIRPLSMQKLKNMHSDKCLGEIFG